MCGKLNVRGAIKEKGEAGTNSSSSDKSIRELQQEGRQTILATSSVLYLATRYDTVLNDMDTTESVCTCPTAC